MVAEQTPCRKNSLVNPGHFNYSENFPCRSWKAFPGTEGELPSGFLWDTVPAPRDWVTPLETVTI